MATNKAISLEQMSRIWGKVKTYVATAISGLYTKPSGGIPKSDLSSDVQTSLGKADSALQSHQDISGKQDVISDLATIRSGAALGATAIQQHQDISGKQDVISDLATIRSGASAGATALQPSDIAEWAKQPTRPVYTANDTGALPNTTTLADLEDATYKTVTPTEKETWNGKQDAIADLADIRSGAALGATALQEHQDISGKADKVQNATANNVALLDANGNCIDSGKDFTPQGIGALPSNTNVKAGYDITIGTALKAKEASGGRMIVLTYDEEYMLPLSPDSTSQATKTYTDLDFDPFGVVCYYELGQSRDAGSLFPLNNMWSQFANSMLDPRYPFNLPNGLSSLTKNRAVYLVMVPQSNGRCKLHSSVYTQTLPTTEDGLVYKFLGIFREYGMSLLQDKPCYYYKDGKLRLWTGG